MDDPRWLRLVTIGLVLAALAVGYFLLTGKIFSPRTSTQSPISGGTPAATASPSAAPSTLGQNTQSSPVPTSTPTSAYQTIANRTRGETQTLPNTGFPAGLILIFSAGAVISGWSLRKFPN